MRLGHAKSAPAAVAVATASIAVVEAAAVAAAVIAAVDKSRPDYPNQPPRVRRLSFLGHELPRVKHAMRIEGMLDRLV